MLMQSKTNVYKKYIDGKYDNKSRKTKSWHRDLTAVVVLAAAAAAVAAATVAAFFTICIYCTSVEMFAQKPTFFD